MPPHKWPQLCLSDAIVVCLFNGHNILRLCFLPVICLYVYLLTILHKILMGAFVKMLWGCNSQILRSCWRSYWLIQMRIWITLYSLISCLRSLSVFVHTGHKTLEIWCLKSVILSPCICYNILILQVKESPSRATLALRTALISDLAFCCPQPDTRWSCKTMDTGLLCCTVCLFTAHIVPIPNYTAWGPSVWMTCPRSHLHCVLLSKSNLLS